MTAMHQRPDFRSGVQRVTHPQCLHPLRQCADKTIPDATLDQQATAGGAALAVEAVDHEHHRIQGALEIRVVKHQHRVLATEFEVHPLQGSRPLAHDMGAGIALPHQGHRLDRGMLGEGFAGHLAKAVDRIPHPRGNAGLAAYLRQDHRGQRTEFRWLVHYGTTRRQRRRDLPGGEHERRVPGCDDRHRPDRGAQGIVGVLLLVQRQAIAGFRGLVGEKAKIGGPAHGGLLHEPDGLATVHALHQRDLLGPRNNPVRKVVEQFLARCTGHGAPFGERCLGGLTGGVDVVRTARHHFPQRGVVCRRQVVEGAAAGGDYPLTVDEMAGDLVSEGRQERPGPGQVGFEVGHGVLASLCSHEERLSEK